ESRGALAVFGRCYESEGAVPYSPFVEMVEQALSVVPPEWIREDLADDAAEVARMVPELRRRFPDIGEPIDLPPEQQRRYFYNASVADMLEALAERSAPQVLIDAIYSETEGNPFFVEEVFRHFVEEGKVFDEKGEFLPSVKIDELDVPESVRLVVGRRLERLG